MHLRKGMVTDKELEVIAMQVHQAYCVQYEVKHGKPYWTLGDYSKLDEETKEFDRATVRTVIGALKILGVVSN